MWNYVAWPVYAGGNSVEVKNDSDDIAECSQDD